MPVGLHRLPEGLPAAGAAGGRALVHTFVNTETKEAGGRNCMIAFQDIYTV